MIDNNKDDDKDIDEEEWEELERRLREMLRKYGAGGFGARRGSPFGDSFFDKFFGGTNDIFSDDVDVESFRIRRRPGEEPEVERFDSSEERELGDDTFVEVLEGDEDVKVVADVTGLQEGEVTVDVKEDNTVHIWGENETQSYDETIEIETDIENEPVETKFNNGVLTVVLEKRSD